MKRGREGEGKERRKDARKEGRKEGRKEKPYTQKLGSQSFTHFLHCRTFQCVKIILKPHNKSKHTLANEPPQVRGKGKIVPLHATKTYSVKIVPIVLDLSTRGK